MTHTENCPYEQIRKLEAINAELMAALNNALVPFNEATRNPSGSQVGGPSWCKQARAAIAKAQGKRHIEKSPEKRLHEYYDRVDAAKAQGDQ